LAEDHHHHRGPVGIQLIPEGENSLADSPSAFFEGTSASELIIEIPGLSSGHGDYYGWEAIVPSS
jgi:hypothetical protein